MSQEQEYEGLIPFASTQKQAKYLQAAIECGGIRSAARELGVDHSTVFNAINSVRKRAAAQGYAPNYGFNHEVPAPHVARGISNLWKKGQDEPVLSWVKSSLDDRQYQRMIEEFTSEFIKDMDPVKTPPRKSNDAPDTDIIPWFQIGDGHLGMLAHEAEVGHNFDLKIAEQELTTAMQILIEQAPSCERCVIQDLGDMTHYETFSAKTEASGHDLDYDSRYPKMIHVYARTMRRIVDMALAKFNFVDVIVNQGNHSRSNDVWMKVFLQHVYSETDRLKVLDNSNVFIPYRMGNTFVMCHHSDKCKPKRLAEIMQNDYAQDWGESQFRYIDIGHIHHRSVAKENEGVTVESWNQLAPADKYAHDGGWRSRSCLTVVLRSKTYGEKGRITLTAEEVKDRIGKLAPGTTSGIRKKVYTV